MVRSVVFLDVDHDTNRFDWNAVTSAVPCANLPLNFTNVVRCSSRLACISPCKRNDTAFAGVIDTSPFNQSSIDPLVNYRQSPGTNHHCGDIVTGHQSIHAVDGSFLPIVSMYFTSLLSFLSFVYLFAQLFHLLFYIFFLSFHIWIFCASHLLLSYISLSSMIEISLQSHTNHTIS